MDEPIPILMNMHAGAIHGDAGEDQLQRMAAGIGLDVRVIRTRSEDDYKQQIAALLRQGAPKIAVAGGDGTVALAVQQLAHTQTALGILSQGTFNNFATTLRLHHNLPAALKTLKDGQVQLVDVGKVGERYFTESAGVGLFADSLALYGRGGKTNVVRAAYSVTRLALSFAAQEMTVTIDGHPHTGRITACEVCNTYRIGPAAPIAPEADPTDGLLDVVLFTDLRRREVKGYLRALRAQMHLGLPKVSVYRAKEVTIETRRRRNVHADDGIVGFAPQTITVEPGALKVLVDQEI